jgi:phenylpyruvate tautomerase PptA (4-oxalocrotonate tautomerase family)
LRCGQKFKEAKQIRELTMPIVRVDVPPISTQKKDVLRREIKRVINEILDPGQNGRFPETCKWIYVSIREAYGELGDGLPTVTIDTRPGRKQEQKLQLANTICDVFEKALGTRDVYVLLRETQAADHIGGGIPLPEWRPAVAVAS